MKNFIPPTNVLGTIKLTPKDWAEQYYIGEAHFAIEKIGDHDILNIWAHSFHYEIHNGQNVLVGDVSFEIMQALNQPLNGKEIIQIDFPSVDQIENNWEELYYSHFYQFEHLKITNWEIKLTPENEIYKVKTKGFITDDINIISENHFFESIFETQLTTKINSKFNWHYTSKNPNAINVK